MKNQVSLNGMLSMRKVISEKGKKTIEAFVKENLSRPGERVDCTGLYRYGQKQYGYSRRSSEP